MARRPKGSVPSYCLHKQSGQACFNWPLGAGKYKVILLGKHGSPESHQEYERVLAEWRAANGGPPPEPDGSQPDLTIAELLLRFWKHAQEYYRHLDGSPTSEQDHYRVAIKPVLEVYGDTLAREFGPLALKAVRQRMLDAKEYQVRRLEGEKAKARWVGQDKVKPEEGLALFDKKWVKVEVLGSRQALCRKVINQRVDHVRRVFKWAVSEQLVAHEVYEALTTVAGLRRGQKGARDKAKVKPVADEVVEATLPYLRPPVRAMVQIQRLTGARPTEVCLMRGRGIDRSGPVWWYRIDPNEIPREGPANLHKTAHHESSDGMATVKLLPIGPKAQAILKPFLEGRDPDAFLFQPKEALQEQQVEKRSK